MWIKATPSCGIFSDKSQPPFGIPRVANPLTEIKIQSVDEETIFARFAVCKNFEDGFREFRRNRFICIETQNPRLRATFQRDIFLRDKSLPCVRFKNRAKFFRNFTRPVRRAGINHDNFRREITDAFKAARKIFSLVQGDDGNGNGKWFAHVCLTQCGEFTLAAAASQSANAREHASITAGARLAWPVPHELLRSKKILYLALYCPFNFY